MCGLIAFVGRDLSPLPVPALRSGLDQLRKCGPDGDEGIWLGDGVLLGLAGRSDYGTRSARPEGAKQMGGAILPAITGPKTAGRSPVAGSNGGKL